MCRTIAQGITGCFLVSILLSGCFLFRTSTSDLPFEAVQIPGGAYVMGDVFEEENEDATPVHEVRVAPFEISTYEITYDQYDAYAAAVGAPLPEDDGYGRGQRAVVHVSWQEALDYCRHYGFRLPTEQEWEYAARSLGERVRYPGTNDVEEVDRYVRHLGNSARMHSFVVGTKEPNRLGLYDMGGNAFEWIGDYYEFYPEPGTEPVYKDLEGSSIRIIRGGSFKMGREIAQTYWRAGTLGDLSSDNIGFRCARPVST